MSGGLYAIVDPALLAGRDPCLHAEAILRGGCSRLQLRWKNAADRDRLELARALKQRCARAGVPFVMNDRPDIALLVQADGLHLGQDDSAFGPRLPVTLLCGALAAFLFWTHRSNWHKHFKTAGETR